MGKPGTNVDKGRQRYQIMNGQLAKSSWGNTLKTSLSAYSARPYWKLRGADHIQCSPHSYRNGVGSITDVAPAERQLLGKNAETDAYSTALSAVGDACLGAGVLDPLSR
jgi:hypothetical protein